MLSTAIGKSGWVVLFSPGWRPPVFQAGGRVFSRRAGLGRQRDHPLAREGLGEPVRVALGDDQVGVVEQPVDGGGGEGLRHDGVEAIRGWHMFVVADLPCYLRVRSS
jgi:hypothetical protein